MLVPFPHRHAHQGQGGTTELKVRGIGAAITVTMRICTIPKLEQFPYWHIDLNAGSGYNHEAGCIGSPLAFLNAAEKVGKKNYRAFFCDINRAAISELRSTLLGNPRCSCIHENNRVLLPEIARLIRARESNPHFAMGTVLCDPNGYFYGDAVPTEELYQFCREFPRIDVILNLNVTIRRWIRGNIAARRRGWEDKRCLRVDELPDFLNRKHWLIRDLASKGGHQFTVMVGRNHKMDDHQAMHFHHLHARQGRNIVAQVETADVQQALFSARGEVTA